jgi:hypothetical protein
MPSASFIVVQTILLVTVVAWAKAGLAEWSNAFIAVVIVVGLVGAPFLRRRETGGDPEIPWKATMPVLGFALLGIISVINPSFRNPADSLAYADKNVWETTAEVDFKQKQQSMVSGHLSPEELPKHYAFLNERLLPQLLLFQKRVEEGNVDHALARFLLASRYLADYSSPTIFRSVFDEYLTDLKTDSGSLLPSSVNGKRSWVQLYPLVLIFLQGIWVHAYIRKKRYIRFLLGAVAVNCVLLAMAGIGQKLAYDPNALRPGIWGIWDVPVNDKNYYFASFTYKNHWCAYAVLGFGIIAGLIARWLRSHPGGLLRGSPVPLALLGMGILAFSIPFSGSVLGILLLLCIGMPFVGFLCFRLLPVDNHGVRKIIACAATLLLPALGVWLVLGPRPDIKRETIQKISLRWQALQEGQMPWRYHHSKDSWAMFSDKPLFGWGLGSTFPLYPLYVSREIITQSEDALKYAHHKEKFFFVEHSHNDWFQYLAEAGVVGVGLLLLTPLFALRRIRVFSPLIVWPLVACSILVLFSFVDFPSRSPACAILFATTFACSIKYADRHFEGR